MTKPTADNNSLDALLRDINRGRVLASANEEFTALVRAVREHGKAGSLTLKVNVAPFKGSDASRVIVSARVETKEPSQEPHEALYFTTEEGAVVKNDPDQMEMKFRPIAGAATAPAAETETADEAAG